MESMQRIGGDEVQARLRRATDALGREVGALRDARARAGEPDDLRELDAWDALEDVALITSELCGLLDALDAAAGDGRRADPWARPELLRLDPEQHDPWLKRHRARTRAAAAFRQAFAEELELARPLNGRHTPDARPEIA